MTCERACVLGQPGARALCVLGACLSVPYYYVPSVNDVQITDMVSFYTLPSTILGHPEHSELRAAYMYYTGEYMEEHQGEYAFFLHLQSSGRTVDWAQDRATV